MADPLPAPDSAPAAPAPEPSTPSAAAPTAAPPTPPTESTASTASSPAAPRGESRTTRLYRAALGPVNTARYLRVFERFDAVGRRLLVWNPAAGLFTLGWLVFRRLWKEALVYAVLAACAIGLGLWAWPLMQAWPPGVRWGLLGALGLLGVLLPGLLGDGWVHRQVQRRLLRAVTAAQSMDEARAALARQAATPTRLWTLVAAHAAVLAALWLVWDQGLWPAATGPYLATTARPVPTAPAASPPVATASVAPRVPTVVEPPPLAGLAGPAGTGSDAGVAVPEPVPALAQAPMQVPVQAPAVVTAPPVRPKPATADPAPALPATPNASAPAPVTTVARTTPVPAGVVSARPPAAPAVAYAINVGLFADAGNARRAQERLQQAGLPVVVQSITTAQGPRTRVRVGPYPQRARADEAAARIRSLGLEAVVFRQ